MNQQGKSAVTSYDSYNDEFDEFEQYEEQFDPLRTNRQARRKRKPRVKQMPKKTTREIVDEIADPVGLEGGFDTTYQPSRYEAGWLHESLRAFYGQQLITDVLSLVRGGKEASVYLCKAHPTTGQSLLAVKVYRPRMFRQLRNDSMYRQGRQILKPNGSPVKKNDHRIMRAIDKKTAFGVQVQHTSWLMHEYTTLKLLHQAGACVPQPFASSENAILMSYYGDIQTAAPMLNTISLGQDEAKPLFKEVLDTIELMLQHDLIHGDLSAYNILYWAGEITIIDFPQVTSSRTNPNAYFILQRDITRVCEYFSQQGVKVDASAIMEDLWYQYGYATPNDPAMLEDFLP